MERPLIPILADIERAGVRLDLDALARLSQTMQGELDRLSASIFSMAGEEFNITRRSNWAKSCSNSCNCNVEEDRQDEDHFSRDGRARGAGADARVAGLVLKWRSVQKLKGTYVDALPLMVNPATGRVHTTFNQAVAATGRLNGSDPNLQNIPVRTAAGREIRAAFVAAPGLR